jgi:hypothetical protein
VRYWASLDAEEEVEVPARYLVERLEALLAADDALREICRAVLMSDDSFPKALEKARAARLK